MAYFQEFLFIKFLGLFLGGRAYFRKLRYADEYARPGLFFCSRRQDFSQIQIALKYEMKNVLY